MSKDFKDCYSSTSSIQIGNKTFITGKVTIGDIISFQNWCNKEVKKELIELSAIAGVKPTIKELRNLVIDPELYDQKSSTLEGVIFLFNSVIQRLNKDVDEDYIKDNITVNDIERISLLISEEDEGEEPVNFPKKKKSKKKTE